MTSWMLKCVKRLSFFLKGAPNRRSALTTKQGLYWTQAWSRNHHRKWRVVRQVKGE